MPRPIIWTQDQNDHFRRLNCEGASIRTAARQLGVGRSTICRRRQRLQVDEPDHLIRRGPDPLPAGHGATWSAISAGTWSPCAA